MKKVTYILLLVLCSLFLTGCWDSNEPERLVYAHGAGIDYKDGQVIIYVQIVNLQGLAKAESRGGEAKTPANVGIGKGETLLDAIFDLYHTTDRRIFWGHLSYVVFSKAAVNHGEIRFATDFFDRYREMRYNMFYYITDDSIEDTILSQPVENTSLAFLKLSDPMDNYEQSSNIKPITMREFIMYMDEPPHQVKIPMIKLRKNWKNKEETETALFIEKVAVISENKILGEMKRGTRTLNEDFVRDNVTIFSNTGKQVSTDVYNHNSKVIPVIKKGKVQFNIKLTLDGTVEQNRNEQINSLEIEKKTAKYIKNSIRTAYEEGRKRGIDTFLLSNALYRHNNKVWKKIEKNGQIPLEKDTLKNINVQVKLISTGKQTLPPVFDKKHGGMIK